ncbi:MAG TPA: protoheme IX farnesyltransferase [Saprospiraceae bacterium]|nr:protoheme IX farnesyltransferase [Saprospiraceae bacterium]
MFRIYADLTKLGIVIFVILAGLAGYAVSYSVEQVFEWSHLLKLIGGLYFLSSGSLVLNQLQELNRDRQMPRTSKRPIATGKIKPMAAAIIMATYILIGSDLLFQTSILAGVLGWLTIILYNLLYVYWWKPQWAFAAVPGAIPGALPATIGVAANSTNILSPDSIYLFLILFLWQMPHFWVLAIRFKDDYMSANIPVLPNTVGIHRTLFHIGLWTFVYVGVAILAPLFVHAAWVYLALVIPISVKIMQEFYRYYKSNGEQRWLAFFLWLNGSVLIFMFIPIFDKWGFLIHNVR